MASRLRSCCQGFVLHRPGQYTFSGAGAGCEREEGGVLRRGEAGAGALDLGRGGGGEGRGGKGGKRHAQVHCHHKGQHAAERRVHAGRQAHGFPSGTPASQHACGWATQGPASSGGGSGGRVPTFASKVSRLPGPCGGTTRLHCPNACASCVSKAGRRGAEHKASGKARGGQGGGRRVKGKGARRQDGGDDGR